MSLALRFKILVISSVFGHLWCDICGSESPQSSLGSSICHSMLCVLVGSLASICLGENFHWRDIWFDFFSRHAGWIGKVNKNENNQQLGLRLFIDHGYTLKLFGMWLWAGPNMLFPCFFTKKYVCFHQSVSQFSSLSSDGTIIVIVAASIFWNCSVVKLVL